MEPEEGEIINDLTRTREPENVNICSDYDDGGVKVWYKDENYTRPQLIMHADKKQMRYLLKHIFEKWNYLLFACETCDALRHQEEIR